MSEFLIYKSSAGSGKTTALIQVFLKLSLSSNSPNQFKKLLAITFTNKAADEMKERFIHELDKLSKLDSSYSGNDFMVDWLLDALKINISELSLRAKRTFEIALQDYNDISISTIDRFNHRLIRSFSRDLDFNQDFEVLVKTNELYQEAVLLLIDKFGRNKRVTKYLLAFMKMKFGEEEKINIHTALMDLERLVMHEKSKQAIGNLEGVDFDSIGKSIQQGKQQFKSQIQKFGTDLIDSADSVGMEADDFSGKKSGVYGFFLRLKEFRLEKKEIPAKALAAIDKNAWITKTAASDIKEKLAAIEGDLHHKLSEAIQFIETNYDTYLLQSTIGSKLNLIAVLEELSICIDEICDARNYLPLYTFNGIISDMLREEPVAFLYEKIGSRYAHVLIDEYQDTSGLQWFNLLPLIEESLSSGNTSLVVGDAKQSIYRFRGGKAEQLISLPKLIDAPEGLDASVEHTLIHSHRIEILNSNYRSEFRVVDFNNKLFASIGTLFPSVNPLHLQEYQPDNVAQKIPTHKKGGLVKIRKFENDDKTGAESTYIMEQIRACAALGYSYGDMAVLVRSAKDGAPIIQKLREANIAVSTAESLELDQNPEVRLMLSFLRVALDPNSNAGKIGIMRNLSFIHSLDFDPTKYLHEKQLKLNQYLVDQSLPTFDSAKNTEGIYDTAEKIQRTYLPDSADPYLAGFMEVIIQNIGYNGTIKAFFDWWDGLGKKPSLTSENSSNAVKVMTIHKSKGLQFKLVFLPKAGWKFSNNKAPLRWFDLSDHPEALIPQAPLPVSKRLADMGLEDEWNVEDSDIKFDNLNLLYVALTRAEQGMFLCYNVQKESTGEWLDKSLSHLQASTFASDDGYSCEEIEDKDFEIILGNLAPNAALADNDHQEEKIRKPKPSQTGWAQRVAFSSNFQSADQKVGLVFHQLVSEHDTLAPASEALNLMRERFGISESEFQHIDQMLYVLFTDQRFDEICSSGIKYSERDLIFGNNVLRPDLLIESDDSITILDFKTGDESEDHHLQVSKYMEAAQGIGKKSCKGYLLYISEKVTWVEVAANDVYQASLFG